MLPLRQLDAPRARAVEVVFTDIDGTLTDADGRVPAAVFAALEQLRAAGLRVVPITGRPAGWCDLIARTWPVDAVVGENGGLWFRRVRRDGHEAMDRHYEQDASTRRANRARLDELAREVLTRFPGAALASDQGYREFDLAVDFREDVPALGEQDIDGIVALLRAAGCRVKVSNIHVNAWFGDFDKGTTCRRFARQVLGWDLDTDGHRAMFFGDSPNDSPLFALFPLGVGVANVVRLRHRMDHLPAYVCEAEGGAGFVEGADHLLAQRGL